MHRPYVAPVWPHSWPKYLVGVAGIALFFTIWMDLGRYGFVFLFLLGTPAAWYLERKRQAAVQEGVNRRGPKLRTWREWNRSVGIRGGIAWWVHDNFEREEAPFHRGMPHIRMRKKDEVRGFGFAGDPGSGKTSCIKQILYQVEQRGDVAVVNDPKGDYLAEFYRADRGDVILNPGDARCPYWDFAAELPEYNQAAVALSIATSLLPDTANVRAQNPFFVLNARNLIAFLIHEYKPSAKQFADWFADPRELDLRIAGTEHGQALGAESPEQRNGFIGTVAQALFSLRLLPKSHERTWSARAWVKNPKGWIFVTSEPETADALRPVQTMWLDLLLTHQLAGGGKKTIWNVYDELDSLKKLPKLQDAMTKMRFTGNRMVIGYQNQVQLKENYGENWKAIASACGCYWIGLTREPTSAQWLSDICGKVSNDRIREQRTTGNFFRPGTTSYSEENREEALVLASEIQTLPPTQGYFVYLDMVAKVKLPYFPTPKRGVEVVKPRVETCRGTNEPEPVASELVAKQMDIDFYR